MQPPCQVGRFIGQNLESELLKPYKSRFFIALGIGLPEGGDVPADDWFIYIDY